MDYRCHILKSCYANSILCNVLFYNPTINSQRRITSLTLQCCEKYNSILISLFVWISH